MSQIEGAIPVAVFKSESRQINTMAENQEALEAQGKILDTLKCPCCWQFVGMFFEQCENSHTVCSQCRKHIPHCPTCRGRLIGKPIVLAEIIEILIKCRKHIPHCPTCRGWLAGKSIVLAEIIEILIKIFEGLSSGDKAIDAYLRKGLKPESTDIRNGPSTPKKGTDLIDFANESPVYNAALAEKSVKTFLQQQALMFRTSRKQRFPVNEEINTTE